MALLSQRLILIMIFANLMIGIAGEVYHNPTQGNLDAINQESSFLEEREQNFESETGIWGATKARISQAYENSIGNSIHWGASIIRVFVRGINPLSIHPNDVDTQAEKAFVYILILIRSLFMVLVIYEAYLVFKNNKTT